MPNKDLKRANAILEAEHGSIEGQPTYKWEFCENLYFPMREDPTQERFEYVANAETGIIEAQPVYVLKKICPWLHRQWVLCRFFRAPSEREWKNSFGTRVAWPRNGYYFPTNIDLSPGVSPWDTREGDGASLSHIVSSMIRKEREKTFDEHYRDGERIVEARERETDRVLSDKIDDLMFPFPNSPHVPGKKQGVSLPPTKQDPGASAQGNSN